MQLTNQIGSVAINGVKQNNSGAYTVSDIRASEMGKDIAVSVTTADGITVQTLTYSITKYIERMTGKDAKLDALLAALSDYAKAAAGEDVDVDEAYAAVELVPVEGVDNTYATEISVLLTDSGHAAHQPDRLRGHQRRQAEQ